MTNSKSTNKQNSIKSEDEISSKSQDKIVEVIKSEVKEAVTEAVRDVLHQIETENRKEDVTQVGTPSSLETSAQAEQVAPQSEQTPPTTDTQQVSSSLYTPVTDSPIPQAENPNPITNDANMLNDSEPKSKKWIYIVLAVVVVLGLSILGFYLYKTQVIGAYMSKFQPSSAPSPTLILSSAPSTVPTISITEATNMVAKSKITIQILNGSGIAGEASVLKDLLSELGFTDIETGNSDEGTSVTTRVIFDKLISKDYQASIEAVLAKNFTKVETKNSASPSAYMVLITTGERKK